MRTTKKLLFLLVSVLALFLMGFTANSAEDPAAVSEAASPVRKMIIDSDTGADDASAIILAACNPNIDLLGVTVLVGNVDLEQSAKNALMALEMAGSKAPVYLGAAENASGEKIEAFSVFGADGMGEKDLIHPVGSAMEQDAIDFILETVRTYPGEVEIVALGPATNIAKAIERDPETMKQAKMIWSMGSAGLGPGNASPVAEFNVYADPVAFKALLDSGIPVTVVGLDMCGGEAQWTDEQFVELAAVNETGKFVAESFGKIREFYAANGSAGSVMNCDSLAMTCVLNPDFIQKTISCHGSCITDAGETYAQVIYYQKGFTYDVVANDFVYNVTLVSQADKGTYFDRYLSAISGIQLEKGEVLPGEEEKYSLEGVVVLSRHNIRSPLSGGDSLLGKITPHEWFTWTSNPSELSLRGGILETMMGQYFRQWLEAEGLFPANYRPEEGAVRFYANAKQRTLATARYFAAGFLPVADVEIETHADYDTMDPVFTPALQFVTDEYAADIEKQVAEKGGIAGMEGIHAGLMNAISLLMDVTDMNDSEAYKEGTYGNLLEDETALVLEAGKEPGMTGPIKTATSVADALTLQYYEEADETAAAFGHELSLEDWQKIHTIVDTYSEMLFTAPIVSVNVAHPLLMEIREELENPDRKFSFLCGHDSNVASVLAALGVNEYAISDAVEQHTPIGVKLVFARYRNAEGKAFYKVSLLYQNPEQLRGMTALSLEQPPMEYALSFADVPVNEEGLIAEEDLLALFDRAIAVYDDLLVQYGVEAAAADEAA
ncbi:MAG: nucleoside hydrolase [Lachnospiraceae bacterium]|nr:nucleoside hydrolase [Lachnospiraceae bacterium]